MRITCKCENTIDVDIPASIDLTRSREAEESILDGSFLTITCDACGAELKPELPLRIIDSKRKLDIYLVPEKERYRYLSGRTSYPVGKRAVIGYRELVEKIQIYRENLDDRVIETIKLYFIEKAKSSQRIFIYFQSLEEGKLEFQIHGLRENEIGVTTVPYSFYTKMESELEDKLEREPFKEILTPPYVSAHKIYSTPDEGQDEEGADE